MGLPTGPTIKRESLSVLYALTYMHTAPSFHSENRFDFGHDVTVLQSPESRDLQGLSCRENPPGAQASLGPGSGGGWPSAEGGHCRMSGRATG